MKKDYKKIRTERGITTYDLQKAGISVGTYRSIESGKNYTVKSLEKYLKLLGISE